MKHIISLVVVVFISFPLLYAGEIPHTDLFIPYNKIMEHLNELPAKDQKIMVYWSSDRLSAIAAKMLANAGYSNFYNLKGGMKAWGKN